MKPLVSVIVPVYNTRKFLEVALDSVINQTYSNLEILVIDDGSTDGSSDICYFYTKKDQRIRFFNQENKGVSAARNIGLNHMTGDLVTFLDSDDAYEPEEHYSIIKTRTLQRILIKWDLAIWKYPDAAKELRKEIRKRGKETDIRSFSLKLKLKYWMICYGPHLMGLMKKMLMVRQKCL